MLSHVFNSVNKVKGTLFASHLTANIAKISIFSSTNIVNNVYSEAATGVILRKKCSRNFAGNSQENACVGASF